MSLLYQAIQNMSEDYDGNRVGAGFLFGRVKSEEPLEIEIDDKITLSKRFLVVSEHLSDYEIGFELVKPGEAIRDDAVENKIFEIKKTKDFYVEHEGKQELRVKLGELEEFVGEGTVKLLNRLRIDDKVILMRMSGGHQYIVVDRVAKNENEE